MMNKEAVARLFQNADNPLNPSQIAFWQMKNSRGRAKHGRAVNTSIQARLARPCASAWPLCLYCREAAVSLKKS